MAHELATMANGQKAMAFVGEKPWHKLGQTLTADASLDVWRVQAGFDWQALTAPVQYATADGVRVMDDKMVIYRSDTGAALSTMGSGYKIVQPAEVLEFFRDLTQRGGWYLHTAGVLRDGRTLWAMASPRDGADGVQCVVKHDAVRPNLLLSTSLDGTKPTQAGLTAERVVCANTLGFALRDGLTGARGKGAARVSHRSHFDAAAVQSEIGVALETFDAFMQDARELAEKPVSADQAREVLRGIFGQPLSKNDARASTVEAAPAVATVSFADLLARPARVQDVQVTDARSDLVRLMTKGDREQKSVARCLALFGGEGRGAQAAGVAGTAWGLLNAITEHVDHEQGRADTRFEAATFGRGATFKDTALRAVKAL